MASLHPPELDSSSNAADSVASSPRSDQVPHERLLPVRFMCSFGGKILPRPNDNELRYVGGDTRIVAVSRSITFSALLSKLSNLSGINNLTAKHQLPNEDLDALISVTTDEDVENMMEEYDRLSYNHNLRSARLRLFLFSKGEDLRASHISSILNGSSNREQWFLDALNGGGPPPSALGGPERGRSEASSIVSEVPDYLFGLDNSEENPSREPKPKARPILHENVSVSDPGSPAPVASSPFCSTSSVPTPVTELKEATNESSVETSESIVTQPSGHPGHLAWHYGPNAHCPCSSALANLLCPGSGSYNYGSSSTNINPCPICSTVCDTRPNDPGTNWLPTANIQLRSGLWWASKACFSPRPVQASSRGY